MATLSPPEGRRLPSPPTLVLQRPSERVAKTEALLSAFQLNLRALSLLALVVGMFLIYNTLTVAVLQRFEMLGTLRCLGASARAIRLAILAEICRRLRRFARQRPGTARRPARAGARLSRTRRRHRLRSLRASGRAQCLLRSGGSRQRLRAGLARGTLRRADSRT